MEYSKRKRKRKRGSNFRRKRKRQGNSGKTNTETFRKHNPTRPVYEIVLWVSDFRYSWWAMEFMQLVAISHMQPGYRLIKWVSLRLCKKFSIQIKILCNYCVPTSVRLRIISVLYPLRICLWCFPLSYSFPKFSVSFPTPTRQAETKTIQHVSVRFRSVFKTLVRNSSNLHPRPTPVGHSFNKA